MDADASMTSRMSSSAFGAPEAAMRPISQVTDLPASRFVVVMSSDLPR